MLNLPKGLSNTLLTLLTVRLGKSLPFRLDMNPRLLDDVPSTLVFRAADIAPAIYAVSTLLCCRLRFCLVWFIVLSCHVLVLKHAKHVLLPSYVGQMIINPPHLPTQTLLYRYQEPVSSSQWVWRHKRRMTTNTVDKVGVHLWFWAMLQYILFSCYTIIGWNSINFCPEISCVWYSQLSTCHTYRDK